MFQMRVLPADLETYLNCSDDFLGILQAVNLGPGLDWDFQIRLSETTSPILVIKVPVEVSPWDLLDGSIPELHWGTSIEVFALGKSSVINPLTANVMRTVDVSHDINEIRVHDFTGKHLRNIWHDREKISKYLSRFTWVGVPARNQRKGEITWKIVAEKFVFTHLKPVHLGECVSFSHDSYAIDVYSRPGVKETEINDAIFGDFSTRIEFKPLVEAIRRRTLSGALIVLSQGWNFRLSPLSQPRPSERLDRIIQSLKVQLLDSESLNSWVEARGHQKKINEASRLSVRLEAAKNAEQVLYEGRLIGTVPTSEAGASAILHKLEVLGGIPFPKFTTIAWAGADGIDAIADIQFELSSPVRHLQPIEYEFKFENFLLHQHPHEHVELVACWYPSELLSPTEKPWMFKYKDARFGVLVISKVPNLTISTRK
jgi:hypothetical protein